MKTSGVGSKPRWNVCERLFGTPSVPGRRVLVQGAGDVGAISKARFEFRWRDRSDLVTDG